MMVMMMTTMMMMMMMIIKQKYTTQETASQNFNNRLYCSIANEKVSELKRKPMHGQFYLVLERPSVDKEKSLAWFCSSGLKRETDGLITTAQDQALNSHFHQKNVMKQPTDSKCKMCCKAEEHVTYVAAGCTTLALSKYTNRHNKVAGYIHRTICKHMGLQDIDKYHEHIPHSFMNVDISSIMWHVPAITDCTVQYLQYCTILPNRPDLVLHYK